MTATRKRTRQPYAPPPPDEIAITEAMAGRPVPLSRLERAEAIHRLVAAGHTPGDIADRLRIRPGTVSANLRRHRHREDPVVAYKGSSPLNVPAHNPTPQGRWTDQAACTQTDPEVFHPPQEPPRKHPNRYAEWQDWVGAAKAICNGSEEWGTDPCPVRAKCLEWALANDEWGVWGGLTDEERKKLKKGGRRAA